MVFNRALRQYVATIRKFFVKFGLGTFDNRRRGMLWTFKRLLKMTIYYRYIQNWFTEWCNIKMGHMSTFTKRCKEQGLRLLPLYIFYFLIMGFSLYFLRTMKFKER